MAAFSVDSLNSLPDEALVQLCGTHPQAIDILLERYRNTVACMAHGFAGNPADREDYAQEGLLGLLAAASSYESGGAASFRTYAVVCIRNRMRNVSRKEQAGAAQAEMQSAISLDDPENCVAEMISDDSETPEQAFLEKERISELYAKLADILSKQEREIFWLSVSGLSYEEIAARLSVSVKSVDNAIQRARRKLRSVWNHAETSAAPCAEP